MAQSVKRLTLGFGSGQDLTVHLGSLLSGKSAWDSLSPSPLCISPASLSLSDKSMNKS